MSPCNRIFPNVHLAFPLLLLTNLPADALEIAQLRRPPPGLHSSPSAISPEQAKPPPVGATLRLELTLLDNFGLESRTVERIRLEVEDIFASMATDIEWLDRFSPTPVKTVAARLRVILIPSPPTIWRLGSRTMGVVFKTEGSVEDVYIFPPAVMNTLHRLTEDARRNRLPKQNRRWARALGRVISHEIIHAIAPEHPHAPGGLMQARLSRFSLNGPELSVDALSAEVFLAHLQSRMQTAKTARLR
jgi:hypothetical protein